MTRFRSALRRALPAVLPVLLALAALPLAGLLAAQQEPAARHAGGGEAALVLPPLDQATFLGGINGRDAAHVRARGLRPGARRSAS